MAIGSRTVDIKPLSGDQEHAGDCMSYANFKNSNESFGKPPSRGSRSKVQNGVSYTSLDKSTKWHPKNIHIWVRREVRNHYEYRASKARKLTIRNNQEEKLTIRSNYSNKAHGPAMYQTKDATRQPVVCDLCQANVLRELILSGVKLIDPSSAKRSIQHFIVLRVHCLL